MSAPPARHPFAWAVTDTLAVTKRNLLRYRRVPTLLVVSTVQPVMFVLLFTYVFGGAIRTPGVDYVDFLMPGVFAQTMLFGALGSGIGLAEDLSTGLIDRFRSLPMARTAVLAGRTLSDAVRNLFVVLLMVGVGSAIGFRFHAGFLPAVGMIVLSVLFGHAMCWMGAFAGLVLKDPESTQAAAFVWTFPLLFISSAFVPIESMSGWLQAVAKANPVNITIQALRALALGGPTATRLWQSLAWVAGLILFFAWLAVGQYRRLQ